MAYDYRVQVWLDGDRIMKDAQGNFTVTGNGTATILFVRREDQSGWKFRSFSIANKLGHPTGGLFGWRVDDHQIELTDDVKEDGRSTYTIEIERNGQILTNDPEIKNVHGIGTPAVTPGVT